MSGIQNASPKMASKRHPKMSPEAFFRSDRKNASKRGPSWPQDSPKTATRWTQEGPNMALTGVPGGWIAYASLSATKARQLLHWFRTGAFFRP